MKMKKNSIYTSWPASLDGQSLSFEKIFTDILNPQEIIDECLNLLSKAKNSFEGVENNRIVLIVLRTKVGHTMFLDKFIIEGTSLLDHVRKAFSEAQDVMCKEFKEFDKAYLIYDNEIRKK